MTISFSANGVPELLFGRGVFETLPQRAANFGTRVLLIGDGYLQDHPSLLKEVSDHLLVRGLSVKSAISTAKQTQEARAEIESAVDCGQFDCFISLGGGRAIDTGKLVAQNRPHIAVPTTPGTGAPMNAIIFGGDAAVEETFRTNLLPDIVIGDPSFIDEMDRDDFAARSLAVLMGLIEAYVSPKSSVLSDALIWSGLESFAQGFVRGVEGDPEGRDRVFYASLMAGVGAGQAGFGLTHRIAVLIEQQTGLTYAQARATVCAELTDLQIGILSDFLPDHSAMDKYAMIGELLAERPFEDREEAYASLIGTLRRWIARLMVPKTTLNNKQLKDLCTQVKKDWDDTVLPVQCSKEDLEATLLRRNL